jgi:hypothetical protein
LGLFSWIFGSPNAILVRQVGDLTHELKHMAQDIELLEQKFMTLQGKVAQVQRPSKKKQQDDNYEDDLTDEQRNFLNSTVEYQNFIKQQNHEKR